MPDALVCATAELYPQVDSLLTGGDTLAKVKGAGVGINRMGGRATALRIGVLTADPAGERAGDAAGDRV